jgi:hypothetical protein
MDGPTPDAAMPRTLPGWLPFLWSRVLFPGADPSGEPPRTRSIVLLLVLPAVLLYPCLAFPLFEPDESRYGEIPREMLQRGDWVTPYLQGEPYLEKPPLLYWITAASFHLFGVHDWAARLPLALTVHLCILTTYFFGLRFLGERAAFWGALLVTLAPGFMTIGRLLIIDGLLTALITAALFAAFAAVRGERLHWGCWLTAAGACGLGMLSKGPVALVLIAPPLAIHLWLSGKPLPRLGAVAAFLGVAGAIAVPWYVALCVRSPKFAKEFFVDHNILRFLTPFAHEQGVWFYIPVMLLGLLPATLFIYPFVRFLGTTDPTVAAKRPPALSFLLLAGGWCLLFFTLSACKLPTYVLPAFPPLALAFGWYLAHGRRSTSRIPAAVTTAAFALLAFVHLVGAPWYARWRSPMNRPGEVRRLCGDSATPVVCYPRNCDSVAFYLGRDDLRSYRSKEMEQLRKAVRDNPRTVILCTHRHSLVQLHQLLPPDVRIVEEVHVGLAPLPGVPPWAMKPIANLMGETALGLCDLAVVERGDGEALPPPPSGGGGGGGGGPPPTNSPPPPPPPRRGEGKSQRRRLMTPTDRSGRRTPKRSGRSRKSQNQRPPG